MRIIAGSARGKKLLPPIDSSTRPALDRTRESIFAVLGESIEGSRVLDLYAGVGAFGLEALSRGARHATFVDQSVQSLGVLEKNIDNLGFHRQSTVLCGDALTIPDTREADHGYGHIFLDPPFAVFFDTENGAESVFRRVSDLLRRRTTSESSIVVLRIPSHYRSALPFHDFDLRKYGQSKVVFLGKKSLELEL